MTFRLAAEIVGGKLPLVVEKLLASGAYSELQGALLVDNGSGKWAVVASAAAAAGAGTGVGAVSLTPGGTDTGGFNIRAKKEIPIGSMQGIIVSAQSRFRVGYTGSLPANTGGSYGVVRDATYGWIVDFGNTTNLAVKYVDAFTTGAPESQKEVIVEFVSTVIQQN